MLRGTGPHPTSSLTRWRENWTTTYRVE